ncbi:MAG: hypothetical protein H7Z40_03790 [Phycisphaerae bacterium]|nr:hypothetical protein [Gemmatimonadaceae bacterium]
MSYQLNERERKVLLWGALFVIPTLLYFFGVKPFRLSLADKREQLAFEQTALVREGAAIAAAKRNPELQHVADSLMKQTVSRLFSGADDVMTSAELGSYLGEVAEQNHVLLTTATTGVVAKIKSNVRTLNEDIRGESDLQGLLEFLQALERGPKLVRVSRLDISRPTRDADDIETVLFSATVSAYALAHDPSPQAASRVLADSAGGGNRAAKSAEMSARDGDR